MALIPHAYARPAQVGAAINPNTMEDAIKCPECDNEIGKLATYISLSRGKNYFVCDHCNAEVEDKEE